MGLFKKIFKGIGKVFKKIGKAIKKAFKKVGKFFGKLGIFGQIALSFTPLGPMLQGLFRGLGQGALRVLKVGLQHNNPLVKGASWMIDTARRVVTGVKAGFKTVTGAATSFVENTGRFLAKKMRFDIGGPTKFFGRGGDSVLGRVGGEITNNFNDFKDAIGADLFTGPSTRADLIDDKLATTKIGGFEIDSRDTALQSPDMTVKELSQGIKNNLGIEAQGNFDKLFQGRYKGDSAGFLKVIQEDPGFVNKWINTGPKKVNAWYDSIQPGSTTADKNPFEDVIFPDSKDLDQTVKVAATGQKVDLDSTDPGGFSLVNNRIIKLPFSTFSEFSGQAVTSVGTSLLTAAVQGGPEFPKQEPTRALYFDDSYRYRFPQTLTNQPGTQYGLDGVARTLDYDPAALIANNMSLQGDSQGLYGMNWFPDFNYGFPQQQQQQGLIGA